MLKCLLIVGCCKQSIYGALAVAMTMPGCTMRSCSESIRRIMKKTILSMLAITAALTSMPASAQNGRIVTDEWLASNYTKREVMVQVRDGAHIYTAIYEPTREYLAQLGRSSSPIMLSRTPYSLKPYGLRPGDAVGQRANAGFTGNLKGDMANYVADGYIIVMQNVRGKFLSEGEYENMRPYISGDNGAVDTVIVKRHGVTAVEADDATDVYDCVQWLLANTNNNGNVGVKGVSYPGFYSTMAALSRHPAIKAVSPQAPATDWFMGDDAHHNGALCLTDVYRFGSGFYRTRKRPTTKGLGSLFSTDKDIYEYFKDKPMTELSSFFGDSLVFWNDIMAHPDYDKFWQDRDPSVHLKGITVPMLVTGGFYDAEDCYGAFRTYYMLKKLSPACELYMAAGPWYHGGWNNRKFDHLSGAWMGEGSGARYQDNVEYPFFAYYLDGKGGKPAKVNVCSSSETMQDASESVWSSYDTWPPKEMEYDRMYLSGDGILSRTMPGNGVRTIVSDPGNPVPYMNIEASSRDRAYMAADQSFADGRTDVLTYRGGKTDVAVHMAGPVNVCIDLSLEPLASGRRLDADVVVNLIDVRPDGYQMLVRGDVMPLRFRDGFGNPKPVKAGKSVKARFTMCDIDHVLMPGHELMVQVQGSWFPLIAMNPQTYLENPYEAVSSDYKPVRMNISASGSYIDLPVVK